MVVEVNWLTLHQECRTSVRVPCTGEWEWALESGQEARIVQIDFSAAFDRVNHLGILYQLCSVGIGSSVLSILTVSIKPITASYGRWLPK